MSRNKILLFLKTDSSLNRHNHLPGSLSYELSKLIYNATGQAILIIDLSMARAEYENKVAVGFRNHSDLIIVELGLSNFSLGNKYILVFSIKGRNRFPAKKAGLEMLATNGYTQANCLSV